MLPSIDHHRENVKRYLGALGKLILGHKRFFFFSIFIVFPSLIFLGWKVNLSVLENKTGFGTKTLWDWMDLLLAPAAIGIGLWALDTSRKSVEQSNTGEETSNVALQSYFDAMTSLIADHSLEDPKISNLIRTRTLSLLRRTGLKRKETVLQFLYEYGLIDHDVNSELNRTIIDLKGADLNNANLSNRYFSGINLSGAFLENANLEKTNLSNAKLEKATLKWAILKNANLSISDLTGADLRNCDLRGTIFSDTVLREAYLVHTDLRGAVLRGAILSGATLSKTDLREADLKDANLSGANLEGALYSSMKQLEKAKLDGAIMPDGNVYKVGSKQKEL